jgi:hypothetical protein
MQFSRARVKRASWLAVIHSFGAERDFPFGRVNLFAGRFLVTGLGAYFGIDPFAGGLRCSKCHSTPRFRRRARHAMVAGAFVLYPTASRPQPKRLAGRCVAPAGWYNADGV